MDFELLRRLTQGQMVQVDDRALRAELYALGLQETEVRAAKGIYGLSTAKRRLVDQWIAEQKRAQDAEYEAAQADAAARAASAAERAAVAAERAANIAERAVATAQNANKTAILTAIATAIGVISAIVIAYLRPS